MRLSGVTSIITLEIRSSIPFGTPDRAISAGRSRCSPRGKGQGREFLFQLGVSEQVAQRRSQVVEPLDRGAARLPLARNIKPGALAVGDEKLLHRIVVFPTHSAGLFQPHRPGLAARQPASAIALAEAGFERGQAVVVLIDVVGNAVHVKRLGLSRPNRNYKRQASSASRQRISH